MTRKRYRWDIKCDQPTVSSIETTWRNLHKLRPYWYPMDELNVFKRTDESKPVDYYEPYNHRDTHDGQPFHIHIVGQVVEEELLRLQIFQGFFMAYQVAVFGLFIYHNCKKP